MGDLLTTPRDWVAGEVVTAAIMNDAIRDKFTALQASWTAYTPVLTAATTNPTLGTGSSLGGRYMQVGKTVHYSGSVKFGTSGIAAGSGTYSVSLPVAAYQGPMNPIGTGVCWAGAGGVMQTWNQILATTMQFFAPSSTTTSATAAVGSGGVAGTAWAAGGYLKWFLTYEAA